MPGIDNVFVGKTEEWYPIMLAEFFARNTAEDLKRPFFERREFLLPLGMMLLTLFLYLPLLGTHALYDPWEPHYAQVAVEMAENNTWLVPHHRNDDRWFSKPVMLFWMMRLSIEAFGKTEFAVRFPVALMAALGLFGFCFLLIRLFDWRTALAASLVLMTSPQFYFIGRQAIHDGVYVVFQTTALLSLAVGLFREPDKARWIYGFWVLSALAMLTKGMLCAVVPGMAVLGYIMITQDWSVLKRMRFGQGALIFLALALPWFMYMSFHFGMAYPKSFFYYHHFQRAIGVIKKPNNTFEMYIAQIFYGTFPWCAFIPFALWRFVKGDMRDVLGKYRKNLFILCCFLFPYIFFTLLSTKFKHYVFPTVPFLAVIIGYYLIRGMKREQTPYLRFDVLIAVLVFSFVAKDIITNYKHLIHLFIYYYDRSLPRSACPQMDMIAMIYPMGVALGLPFFWRKWRMEALGLFLLITIVFMSYFNYKVIPGIGDTMSQRQLWHAYQEKATLLPPDDPKAENIWNEPVYKEPICEYHSWKRLSPTFYFNNRYTYLDSRKEKGERLWKKKRYQKTTPEAFFKQEGKLFCMIDRGSFSRIRERIKKEMDRDLFIVDSRHPFTYLVSTEAPPKVKHDGANYKLKELPLDVERTTVEFGDNIELLAFKILPDKEAKIGDEITIKLYWKAKRPVSEDWTVFIHGDANRGGGRMIGDHTPANANYPTDRWEPGEIIEDVWKGRIPKHLASGRMEIRVGLFRDEERLEITKGPHDGQDRYRLTYYTLNRDW